MAKKMPDIGDYKYGFHDKDVSKFLGLAAKTATHCMRTHRRPLKIQVLMWKSNTLQICRRLWNTV